MKTGKAACDRAAFAISGVRHSISMTMTEQIETSLMINSSHTCPFCTLDPARIIASNFYAVAVYDDYPVTPGHSLIIPRRHIASFFEATVDEQTGLFELLAEVRKLILQPDFATQSAHSPLTPFVQDGYRVIPDGFNIGINDGVAAGQTVMHLHLHMIPRYAGDTTDPRGGVRWIMPEKAPYWKKR